MKRIDIIYILSYDRNSTLGTVADMFYYTLIRRCLVFQEQIKRKTFSAIKDAFQDSLPQSDAYRPTAIEQNKRIEISEEDIRNLVLKENKTGPLVLDNQEEFGLGDTLPTAAARTAENIPIRTATSSPTSSTTTTQRPFTRFSSTSPTTSKTAKGNRATTKNLVTSTLSPVRNNLQGT